MIQQTPEQRKSAAHRMPEPVITKVIFNILSDKAQAAPIFRADGHTVVISTEDYKGTESWMSALSRGRLPGAVVFGRNSGL